MIRTIHNFWVRTGVLLGAVILACALVCAGPTAAAPLGQAGTGTITGQVLSLNDVPLPNVHLAAFAQGPSTRNRPMLAQVQSDAQGRYSVQVPAGTVWMEFETQDINGQSFWGYDNLPVNVADGQTVTGQDFRVAIRIVSELPTAVVPPTAVPPPPASPLPGMPTTGAGPDLRLPLAGGLGLLLLLFGLALRRRATH
jgi:hypothetical protein